MSDGWTPTEFVSRMAGLRLVVCVTKGGWSWKAYRGRKVIAGERSRYLTAEDAKKAAVRVAQKNMEGRT